MVLDSPTCTHTHKKKKALSHKAQCFMQGFYTASFLPRFFPDGHRSQGVKAPELLPRSVTVSAVTQLADWSSDRMHRRIRATRLSYTFSFFLPVATPRSLSLSLLSHFSSSPLCLSFVLFFFLLTTASVCLHALQARRGHGVGGQTSCYWKPFKSSSCLCALTGIWTILTLGRS